MPRKLKVQLANGNLVYKDDVPDDMMPQEFEAAMESIYGSKVTGVEQLSVGGGIGNALARGVLGGPALLLDALNSGGGATENMSAEPQASNAVRRAFPPGYGENSYLNAAVEGMAGGVGGLARQAARAPAIIPQAAISGSLGGVGAEAGHQLGGTAGGIVGGMLGGGLGAFGARNLTNTGQLSREVMADVRPEDLNTAISNMIWAREQGHSLTPQQAMQHPSGLDDITKELAQSRYGVNVNRTLREQPDRLAMDALRLRGQLPGNEVSPQQAANDLQGAATARIRSGRERANAAYRAEIPPGTQVRDQQVAAFDQALQDYARAHPGNASAQAMANEVRSRLRLNGGQSAAVPVGNGPITSRMVNRTPAPAPQWITDANDLKAAVDDAIQSHGANTLTTGAAAKDLNRYAQNIRTLFDRNVAPVGSPLRNARVAARGVYENEVNPLLKGPVGRLAGRGADETHEAAVAKVTALLSNPSPTRGRGSEVLTVERELRDVNPQAFIDAASSDLGRRLTAAVAEGGLGGRQPADFAAKGLAALTGGKNAAGQVQRIRDTIAGLARSQNALTPGAIDEAAAVRGMENYVRILGMMERRPETVTRLPRRDIQEISGESATATGLQTQALSPGYQTGKKLRMFLSAHAYRAIDEMLTTPEGLERLRRLSRMSFMSPQAVNLVSSQLGSLAANLSNNSEE